MRTFVLRLAVLAGAMLTLGACADSPTQSSEQRAPDLSAPALDEQVAPQGCVIDGLCVLPPISGGWCEPWMELDWDCDNGGGDCMTSAGDPTDPEWVPTVLGCPGDGAGGGGGGTPPPPGGDPGTTCPTSDAGECPTEPVCELDCPDDGEEEENTDICPQPIRGKVATAFLNVAGRNHEFKFEGVFRRVNPMIGRSPAWYSIDRPALSKDGWWMAERGNLLLVCWGRWTLRNSLWVGTIYVQDTELHLVMAPGHPDF